LLRVLLVKQPPCDYADSAGSRLFTRRCQSDTLRQTDVDAKQDSVAGGGRISDETNSVQQMDSGRTTDSTDIMHADVR
jgi:hypothetical protein